MADSATAGRLRTAFELFDAGVDLYRCRLRRERPGASEAEIDRLVAEWLNPPVSHLEGEAARFFRPALRRFGSK